MFVLPQFLRNDSNLFFFADLLFHCLACLHIYWTSPLQRHDWAGMPRVWTPKSSHWLVNSSTPFDIFFLWSLITLLKLFLLFEAQSWTFNRKIEKEHQLPRLRHRCEDGKRERRHKNQEMHYCNIWFQRALASLRKKPWTILKFYQSKASNGEKWRDCKQPATTSVCVVKLCDVRFWGFPFVAAGEWRTWPQGGKMLGHANVPLDVSLMPVWKRVFFVPTSLAVGTSSEATSKSPGPCPMVLECLRCLTR